MSTLTKKHFECIAAALKQRQPTQHGAKLGYHLAITAVANGLQQINPKFDRARFIEAASARGEPISEPDLLSYVQEGS